MRQQLVNSSLTVAVANEPIFMTLSGFLRMVSLKTRMSLRVQIDAGIRGGILDARSPANLYSSALWVKLVSRGTPNHKQAGNIQYKARCSYIHRVSYFK